MTLALMAVLDFYLPTNSANCNYFDVCCAVK